MRDEKDFDWATRKGKYSAGELSVKRGGGQATLVRQPSFGPQTPNQSTKFIEENLAFVKSGRYVV